MKKPIAASLALLWGVLFLVNLAAAELPRQTTPAVSSAIDSESLLLEAISKSGGQPLVQPGDPITALMIFGTQAEDEASYQYFKELADLEELFIYNIPAEDWVPHLLGNLPKLHVLVLSQCQSLDDRSFEAIAQLPELQTLIMAHDSSIHAHRGELSAQSVAHLARLPQLQSLHLEQFHLSPERLKQIAQLPRLRHLSLKDTNVAAEDLLVLKDSPLESLDWSASEKTFHSALPYVSQLVQLKSLKCEKARDKDLLQIAKLTGLEKLELPNQRLSRSGIAPLKDLTQLKSLSLTTGHLRSLLKLRSQDQLLVPISELTELTYLNLAGHKITDSGIRHLLKLDQLQELHLENTAITEAVISDLEKLLNLEKLTLSGTDLRKAELLDLTKMPRLKEVRAIGFDPVKIKAPAGCRVITHLDFWDPR